MTTWIRVPVVLSTVEVLVTEIWDFKLFIIAFTHYDKFLTLWVCDLCQHIPSLGISNTWVKYKTNSLDGSGLQSYWRSLNNRNNF